MSIYIIYICVGVVYHVGNHMDMGIRIHSNLWFLISNCKDLLTSLYITILKKACNLIFFK